MTLNTEYMGLKLKNPILVAAGPWSRDRASIQRSIDAGAGAVVTETITLEANQNPSPRLYMGSTGQMFNTTLFSGLHLEQWEQEFEALQRGDCKLIASIWGNTPSELAYLAGKVERMGADAVEVSVSAPLGTRMEAGTRGKSSILSAPSPVRWISPFRSSSPTKPPISAALPPRWNGRGSQASPPSMP